MKFIDLFAGIGGFRLGMEMAGHECVGHCEIDKFANASYIAMHNPKESEWYEADITRIRAADIPRADCWCFGFPCQDISVAGKQGGFTRGKRSSLFFAVTGLIRNLEEEDRPSYLFIENVKNLLSINRGFDFAKILIELDEIGYDAEWQVLNSSHFGVPQNRERVFIIGHLRGRCGREVFPIGGKNTNVIRQIGNVMPTKTRNNPNQGRVYSIEGLSPSLNTCEGGGCTPIVVLAGIYTQNSKQYFRGIMPNLCRCLKVNKTDNAVVFRNGKKIEIRYLTPRECFRLQGFPGEYFDRAAAVNSDTQLYKQAGNSVTVNVIYEIAKRLGKE